MRTCTSTVQQISTATTQMTDYKTPIVLDSGSGLMKAGFADQDLPAAVFPTVIGRPKYEEVMNSCVDRELYVGHDAQHMRGVLTLRYPIRHGVVSNWDEMEMLWTHAFQLLSAAPEDHPVLLTEAALNPLQNRQRMVELMFEAFSVPLTFVAVQAVLALYASGRTTGVVLDSGDGVSHSVPVFEGYCLPHAVQRLDLAGADVTLQLQKLLLESGVCLRTSAELEIVREMKERCCFVSVDYEAEMKSSESEIQYTLPDGHTVPLASQRFRAPEILFRPELIGRDHYGLHESVFRSILQSDLDLRRSFVGNILLSGGNTLLSGLAERLQLEVRAMVPLDLSACVRVSSPPDRDFSVWSGGAALASLPEQQSAWISAAEYEEFGPQIVFRKCF
nr:Si:ch211-241j12.3 protein [Danio rerio]